MISCRLLSESGSEPGAATVVELVMATTAHGWSELEQVAMTCLVWTAFVVQVPEL